MTKKIEETPKDFWAELWAEYKKEEDIKADSEITVDSEEILIVIKK